MNPLAVAASYWPISLLPVMGKLFGKLYITFLKFVCLHNVLQRNCKKKNNLIIDAQFGFRAQHSTVDQLHCITKFIEDALEHGEYCVAVFLDVVGRPISGTSVSSISFPSCSHLIRWSSCRRLFLGDKFVSNMKI